MRAAFPFRSLSPIYAVVCRHRHQTPCAYFMKSKYKLCCMHATQSILYYVLYIYIHTYMHLRIGSLTNSHFFVCVWRDLCIYTYQKKTDLCCGAADVLRVRLFGKMRRVNVHTVGRLLRTSEKCPYPITPAPSRFVFVWCSPPHKFGCPSPRSLALFTVCGGRDVDVDYWTADQPRDVPCVHTRWHTYRNTQHSCRRQWHINRVFDMPGPTRQLWQIPRTCEVYIPYIWRACTGPNQLQIHNTLMWRRDHHHYHQHHTNQQQ